MPRNLSIQRHFERQAQRHTPTHRFAGTSADDWQRWCGELRPKVLASLGTIPQKVPLNAEVLAEWREHGLVKQKVVFDVEEELSVIAYVFRPEDDGRPLPAILCCHGHGAFGKELVMSVHANPAVKAQIPLANSDYGLQMAQAGFVTMAIDWRGFGERDDRRPPHRHAADDTRDLCNVHQLRAAMFGQTMLGLNLHDADCCLDYLCAQPFVDADRLGVMGRSLGGTMTTWIALREERIKAADIICYADRFADFAITRSNFCGSQMTPGLFGLCDLPDLHGLIAPKPLLVEIGAADQDFRIDSAMSCYREVEKIYQAAGAGDRSELNLFGGGHAWPGDRSIEFFTRWL